VQVVVVGRMGMDEGYAPQSDGPVEQAKVTVKWFNLIKGFGFVAPENGGQDAFLHVSVVNRAGLQKVDEGQELMVTLGRGQRGNQVMEITQVLGAAPARQGGYQGRPQFQQRQESSGGPETEITGAVKWFRPEKGFGFLQADDGDRDVFLHVSVLRDIGLTSIQPGQKVRARVRSSNKGREATALEVLPGMVDVSQFDN